MLSIYYRRIQVALSACEWAGRLSIRQAGVRRAAQTAAAPLPAEVSADAISGALLKPVQATLKYYSLLFGDVLTWLA